MKRQIIFTLMLTGLLCVLTCSKALSQTDDIHSDPVKVVEAVFEAARTGDYSVLPELCDPTGKNDGDTKAICFIGTLSEEDRSQFAKYFSKGKVAGDAEISGDSAKVKILFGTHGTEKEEFNLIRIDGKWYLSSL
ncbi:MAG: hypothetical protein L0Y76_03640 [Ignavibacteria bacterium]|nr:hypothetical protein [Ignavibacteria bacterium]